MRSLHKHNFDQVSNAIAYIIILLCNVRKEMLLTKQNNSPSTNKNELRTAVLTFEI